MCALAHADDKPQRFVVSLPEEWKNVTRILLVFEDVTVPGNVPLKLRVTTTGQDGGEAFLGSTGIEALGRNESKQRHLPAVRLDITRSLKRFLANHSSTGKLEIYVQPVDGRNNAIRDVGWSAAKVRLEIQQE